MSNQEYDPSNNQPVGEKIPHSGVHGFEKPVREFDKTPMADAIDQGRLKTEAPDTPAALHPTHEKEKKKLSTAAKMSIGGLVFGLLPAVGAGAWTMKKMNDVEDAFRGSSDTPSASAPAVPGQQETVENAPEYHYVIEPVFLTDTEIATLEAGDSEEGHKILDEKFIPKIQEAVDQIRENGGKLDGLDLTGIAPSKRAMATLANLDDGKAVEICQTTPNTDGSLNFCGSNHPTKIELGKPIEFWVNDVATEKDYRFRSGSHAEVTDDNRLVLAHND